MVRFALVGCGKITRKHAGTIGADRVPGAELRAVCDLNADAARAYGEEFGVPWFTDMHEMLKEMPDQIDVVSILTPAGYHAQHCIELAPYGKHIVVEKPMALTLQDADSMIAACDQAGIRLFVVKQNRFNRPVVKLRDSLVRGRFGKLVMGTVRVRWKLDQAYTTTRPTGAGHGPMTVASSPIKRSTRSIYWRG